MLLRWLTQFYLVAVLLGTPLAAAWAAGRGGWAAWLLTATLAVQFVVVALVLALRCLNPPITAFLLNLVRERRRAGLDSTLEHRWVPAAAYAPELALAAIAGEDAYFMRHNGFDWQSLRRAQAYNRSSGQALRRGGSTISQQLAKNLFLWQGQNYVRKGLEAYLTLLLEAAWPKRRILEVYLNVAQFGPQLFGAEAAARRFFNKPALALTRSEAALLITALPNPIDNRVDQPDRAMRYRQLLILGSMKKLESRYHDWLADWPARRGAGEAQTSP